MPVVTAVAPKVRVARPKVVSMSPPVPDGTPTQSDQREPVADVPDGTPGRVVAAVEAELELIGARVWRPGLSEVAVSMGRLLDNAQAFGQHASAGRALQRCLEELHRGADTRQGRLAAVQKMTERGGPDAG